MKMKILVAASCGWIVAVLAHSLFSHELVKSLWMLDFAVVGCLALSGASLAVLWVITGVRRRRYFLSLSMCGGCLVLTTIFTFTPYGSLPGTYCKFYRNLDRYEAIVAQIQNTDASTLDEMEHYPDYVIDKGPPVRVAFIWGGMADNWVGIVYDPTGEVMRANQFKKDWSNWNEPDLQKVKRLFGGDLLKSRKLCKNWCFCVFT